MLSSGLRWTLMAASIVLVDVLKSGLLCAFTVSINPLFVSVWCDQPQIRPPAERLGEVAEQPSPLQAVWVRHSSSPSITVTYSSKPVFIIILAYSSGAKPVFMILAYISEAKPGSSSLKPTSETKPRSS